MTFIVLHTSVLGNCSVRTSGVRLRGKLVADCWILAVEQQGFVIIKLTQRTRFSTSCFIYKEQSATSFPLLPHMPCYAGVSRLTTDTQVSCQFFKNYRSWKINAEKDENLTLKKSMLHCDVTCFIHVFNQSWNKNHRNFTCP